MKEYKPVTSLVNGEVIQDLLNLCNEEFTSPIIQRFAGANRECAFCGMSEDMYGEIKHSEKYCPVIKYKDIVEKHKRWIVEK